MACEPAAGTTEETAQDSAKICEGAPTVSIGRKPAIRVVVSLLDNRSPWFINGAAHPCRAIRQSAML